jgi:hypothetical protein
MIVYISVSFCAQSFFWSSFVAHMLAATAMSERWELVQNRIGNVSMLKNRLANLRHPARRRPL